MDKLYSERDAMLLEPFFSMHMIAMTKEELHDKGAIACELAYRDAIMSSFTQKIRHAILEESSQWAGDFRLPVWMALRDLAVRMGLDISLSDQYFFLSDKEKEKVFEN